MVRVGGCRQRPWWAALATTALLLLAPACSANEATDGQAPASVSPVPTEAPPAEPPDAVTIPSTAVTAPPVTAPVAPAVWQACGALECASVPVPLDYDDPAGPTVQIAMVRRAATGTRRGAVFVNPGGPGASGVAYVRNGFDLDPETRRSYDLIGFDPRGVGDSTTVPCRLDRWEGPLPDYSPDSEDELAALDGQAEQFARSCAAADTSGLLAHLGTDDVARDLDRLRAAVGDDQLHYIGFSFGTLIGLVYADAFPDRVGHLVLDGVVDPTQDLTALLTEQAVAFERAFDVLDAACATTLNCPPGGLAAAHAQVMARLEQQGPVGQVGPAELDGAALITLYEEGLWPVYAGALTDALAGDYRGVEALSDTFTQVVPFGVYAGVECTDSPHPPDRAAWARFASSVTALAPRFGPAVANELLACVWWPVPAAPARVPITASGARPVLVVGNTNDPATPLANAEAAAAALDQAALVVVELDGHTAYTSSPCVQRLVRRYLLDDELPAAGTRC